MSLKQAVEAVAADMVEYADGVAESAVVWGIHGFVRQLRMACLAVGDDPVRELPTRLNLDDWLITQEQQRKDAERAAKVAELSWQARLAEQAGERLVELVEDGDGPVTYHIIPPQMPAGAYTQVDGKVYQLRDDGKLHLDAGQTARLRDGHNAPPPGGESG